MPRPGPSKWISFDAEIIPPLLPAFSSLALFDDHDGNTDVCSSSVSNVEDFDEIQATARIVIPSQNAVIDDGNTQSNFNVLNFNVSPYTVHIDNPDDPVFNNQVSFISMTNYVVTLKMMILGVGSSRVRNRTSRAPLFLT